MAVNSFTIEVMMQKRRNTLQELGDRLGMYAYLTVVGGLGYRSVLRQSGAIEEERLQRRPKFNARPGEGVPYKLESKNGQLPAR